MEPIIINPWVLRTAVFLLTIALVFSTWRLVRGPSLFDRIIAMDLISAVIMGTAILLAIENRNSVYLEISTTIAIISFLGTVGFSRYLENEDEE